MVLPTSSTHFPPFCPLSNIREWRTAKMATAVSAHFELQKCSSETYGWRHGHYVQVFYSLWVLHNVPAIYSCVKVIYLLIAAQGSLNSSLQQTMNVILRKCCLQSFISVSAASFWTWSYARMSSSHQTSVMYGLWDAKDRFALADAD